MQPELPGMVACPNVTPPGIEEESAAAEEEEPTSIDPQLRELAHAREEAQEACQAQVERLELIVQRLWWVTAQTLALDHPEQATVEAKEMLELLYGKVERLKDLADNPAEGGLIVSPLNNRGEVWDVKGEGSEGGSGPESGEGTAELVTAIDAGAESTQTALYLLIGCVVGLVIAFAIWRTGALRS